MLLALLLTVAHAEPTLAFEGECPGPLFIDIDAVTPRAGVRLITGSAPGDVEVPSGPCAGRDTGLAGPLRASRPQVDDDGDGYLGLSLDVGPRLCGQLVAVLDEASCEVSTVERVP